MTALVTRGSSTCRRCAPGTPARRRATGRRRFRRTRSGRSDRAHDAAPRPPRRAWPPDRGRARGAAPPHARHRRPAHGAAPPPTGSRHARRSPRPRSRRRRVLRCGRLRRRGRRSRRAPSRAPRSRESGRARPSLARIPRGLRSASPRTRPRAADGAARPCAGLLPDLGPRRPVVDRVPVEVVEERVDVGGTVGLVVEEVRVLVDVERDERCRVPDRVRVLRVADVVEEPALVPVVRRPGPTAPGHAARLEVGAPLGRGAEVALDQVADRAVGVAAAAAEVLEVDLVFLDPADRERELDLERADLRIHLVGCGEVDAVELPEDLVPLVHVALVELVVRLDRGPGDAVELVEARLQVACGDLLELVRQRHRAAHAGTEWEDRPVEQVLADLDLLPEDKQTAVRNNAGGHANHTLFWEIMSPNGGGEPSGALAQAISDTFDGLDQLKSALNDAGVKRFGSGWSWLVWDGSGLSVYSTANQDSPILKSYDDVPLLGIDVWEHSYYLKYQNRRPDYLQAWWNVVNWPAVEARYETAISS